MLWRRLLGALVYLVEERDENVALETSLGLVNLVDEAGKALVALLLVRLEALGDGDGRLRVKRLDARLGLGVLLAVVVVEDLALLGGRELERSVDVPRALVVLGVSGGRSYV